GGREEGVFRRVNSTDLVPKWWVNADPNPGQDALAEIYVKAQILGAYGVDGRRDNLDAIDWQVRRHKAAESEYRRIVALDIGAQEMPGGRGRLGGGGVGQPNTRAVPPGQALQKDRRPR